MSKHALTNLIIAVPTANLSLTKDLGNERAFETMSGDEAIVELDAAGVWFGPRPVLEKDESFRQIIPYVVLRCGGNYLTYVRGDTGGESRLHAKISMGFGGHVDLPDMKTDENGLLDLAQTLTYSVERELQEEIPGIRIISKDWIGLLADNTDHVGRVHVGLIGVWDIEAVPETSGEDAIAEMTQMTPDEIVANKDRLEGWSQALAEYLSAQ